MSVEHPGHPGNELANHLAKKATELGAGRIFLLPMAYYNAFRGVIKEKSVQRMVIILGGPTLMLDKPSSSFPNLAPA